MRILTIARLNFDNAIGDVERLLQYHDDFSGASVGRPSMDLEVLKRSALILTVTLWESYVEDSLRDAFERRLAAANSPVDLSAAFNGAAQYWWERSRGSGDPTWLALWTGEQWKERLRERFNDELDSLNTPNSANVSRLFKRYAEVDVVDWWSWRRTSNDAAKKRLDDLIALRGTLVHRGREFFDLKQKVRKRDATLGVDLVRRLVDRTDEALGYRSAGS